MSVIYRFSYDSPVRYLPLVYLLPYDLISRFPTLRKLPRSMGALNASPEWGEVILSQQFFGEITDAVASLVPPLRLRRLEGALHRLFPGVAPVLRPAPVGQGRGACAGLGRAGPVRSAARLRDTVL